MSLSDMNKTQQQYLLLGVLSLVIVGGLIWFGIRFSLASVTTAREELSALSEKIEHADLVLGKGKNTTADFEHTTELLKEQLDRIPPGKNYYSWATEEIYSTARHYGLEIDSIDEFKQVESVKRGKKEKKEGLYFESYSLRISAHGSYENTRQFLKGLEKEHPLVRVSGLDLSAAGNPEQHDVQVFVQWPFKMNELVKLWDAVREKQTLLAGKTSRSKERVAAVQENPEPKPAPKPEAIPKPVEPEPVVVAETPKPEPQPIVVPAPKPEPKPEVIPETVKPEPVVVAETPKPEPQPVVVPAPKPEPKPESEASDLQSLLASLDSRGEEPTSEKEDAQTTEQDVTELEALAARLAEQAESGVPAAVEPEAEPVQPEQSVQHTPPKGPKYAVTPNSAKKLSELLRKDKPKTADSLDSFLDGLMENIND